jgi:hypothetical protein
MVGSGPFLFTFGQKRSASGFLTGGMMPCYWMTQR